MKLDQGKLRKESSKTCDGSREIMMKGRQIEELEEQPFSHCFWFEFLSQDPKNNQQYQWESGGGDEATADEDRRWKFSD